MIEQLLSFLGHGLECAFWCGVWHYVLHTKDHGTQKVLSEWGRSNHEKAKGAYGHDNTFEKCPYITCVLDRKLRRRR